MTTCTMVQRHTGFFLYFRVTTHCRRQFVVQQHSRLPASRAFLNSTTKKGLCRNRVKSLLSICKPLLGNPQTYSSFPVDRKNPVSFVYSHSIRFTSASFPAISICHCLLLAARDSVLAKRHTGKSCAMYERSIPTGFSIQMVNALGLRRLKRLDTITAEPLLFAPLQVLERLCSHGAQPCKCADY